MLPNTQTDKVPGSYQYGFHDDVKPVYSIPPGLSARVVQEISHIKNEPSWMLDRRLKALEAFGKRPVPVWGANLLDIDFQSICYYLKPSERQVASWDKVPIKIKQTFDKLGIPQAEQKFLSGVGAQYDSEAIYHNLKEEWKKQGVIFMEINLPRSIRLPGAAAVLFMCRKVFRLQCRCKLISG
ncbi:MAG: FeS assembly protein SufB [Parcubacteria group bacterium GW2011_GWB1_43_66]|nr:MAG: FeS assembly protein SufB [Parcubacteria group bacterium GW2011_GWB1_43_66]